ncbi:uncharacterized protein LOC100902446 [Galendromus occidentalis]|uniref:Uncharacterized protein LOC100902446 n=1 Tax=Galendromus occidentalis TaxID=34638 RepID=A0AAJ6QS79_9ACAR|nr:uncharacterized protein LOC100902446 [Galendromus occidentalis]
MNLDTTQTREDFASLLFDLLPAKSQCQLNQIAQLQLQTQSDEPVLNSQDCRIALARVEGCELRVRHINEEFDLIEEDLSALNSDLQSLNEIDAREIEAKLIKTSSDVNLYQMKVNEYGDVTVPEMSSLPKVKALREEVRGIKETLEQWKLKGALHEGVENFQPNHLRNLVRDREEELRKLTETIATKMEIRRSLV